MNAITHAVYTTVQSMRHRRRRTLLVSLGLAGLAIAAVLCHSGTSSRNDLQRRFKSELDALHDKYRFPGATAAFILPDGTVKIVATGLADVEAGVPMTERSRMLAASIGKTFVGATVAALAEEGALDLDDPVSKYLGDRPWFFRLPGHNEITLRQLLTHSSGIANHVDTEDFRRAFAETSRANGNSLSPEELVTFVLDRPPLFRPGSGWAYSDTGYILIGLVIEKVTGHAYYEELTRRFLEPMRLGMTAPSDRRELPGLAAGYTAPDNRFGLPLKTTIHPGVMAWDPGIEWTGGGIVSNPRDLVVWAKALYEGCAIKANYLEELLQSVEIGGHSGVRYGIAVTIRENGPLGKSYGHSGWIPGYCSSLRYYTGHRVAVAFQINTDIGILDSSMRIVDDMEYRLAKVVVDSLSKGDQ
jgi:D-alanyl-D-alanine carboxypeptidase